MAGEIIRPKDLTPRPAPVASELMVVDNSVNVGAATIKAIVEAGRPAASQVEAQTGTDAVKAMTPLTTKQSIASEVGVSLASKAQGDLAATAVQPSSLGTAAAASVGDFATAAQGSKADSALQSVVPGTNILVDTTDPKNPVISASGGAGSSVSDRVALKALNTAAVSTVLLTEAGREGQFVWRSGDYAAQIAADTEEGVYIKADDAAASEGAWVRVYDRLLTRFFGLHIYATESNQVIALQAAINFAQAYGDALHIPAGQYSLNAGVTISNVINLTGDGMNKSVLNFSHAGVYGIKFEPGAGSSNDNTFYSWSSFMVVAPSASYGIYLNFSGAEYMSNWTMERVYTLGSVLGMNCVNTGTVGMFCCTMRRNWFANGLSIINGGDSINILENTINGSGIGIYVSLVGGARQLVIRNNNITTLSECIYLSGVVNAQIESNWMETPFYLGNYAGTTGALLNLENCTDTKVYLNTIQPLDEVGEGFIGANYCIALSGSGANNCIDDNDLSDGKLGHINITNSGYVNTIIGEKNRYAEAAVIADNGVGTIGLVKTLALAGTWVAYATGALDTLTAFRQSPKTVHLLGGIKSGAASSVATTLPVGMRPALSHFVPYFNPADNTNGFFSLSPTGALLHAGGTLTGCFINYTYQV